MNITLSPNSLASQFATKILDLANRKQSNTIVALDNFSSLSDLESFVEKIHKKIVGIKIHRELFEDDFDAKRVKALSTKFDVVVIADGKLCDIGEIARKKLEIMKEWADAAICLAVAGEGLFEAARLAQIPIIVLTDMSSKGHLFHAGSSREEALRHRDVLGGLVTQIPFPQTEAPVLIFSPGINIHTAKDTINQQYRTPEKAVATGTHFQIVGRGISNEEEAEVYRQRGYKAVSEKNPTLFSLS